MTTESPPPTPWLELQVIRIKDGHSGSSLARLVGISKSYYSELESGRRKPNPGIIKRLAVALNVPVSVLEPRVPEEAA
jgi:transcriptional regulator with XRE-family HTH domain